MFGFKKKNANVLSHWYVIVDGFQFSTDKFYQEIEKELSERRVPGLDITRVDFLEGGVLSDKRVYLRMLRERLVFDVCAAPFGRAYFFSLRFAEIPAQIEFWQLLVCFGSIGVTFVLLAKICGLFNGLLVLGVLLSVLVLAMGNPAIFGLEDLDGTLLKSPLVGPIYERFFRKETYYRQDTRLMYHTTVSEVVKKKVEEVTATNGVKFIETHDHSPILDELYKSKAISLKKE